MNMRTKDAFDELLMQLRRWRDDKASYDTTMEDIWNREALLRIALEEYERAVAAELTAFGPRPLI